MIVINHDFGPIYDQSSKILILGSFPSVKSREKSFYYQHPQNRFWKILAHLFDVNFTSSSIDEIKALLQKYHIALYDVVETCQITGSADNTIKPLTYTSIDDLIRQSSITQIYFNGKTAYQLFLNKHPNYPVPLTVLPSTSPANASYRFDDLLLCWQKILH